jgi:hypothetical protein
MAARSKTYYIPEGTTSRKFTLLDSGAAMVGTGFTVTLVCETSAGESLTSPPTVAWLNQAVGTVTVSGLASLAVGEYHVRFKLTDGASDVDFVPNGGDADRWIVMANHA